MATGLFGNSWVSAQQYRQYLQYHWERDGSNIDYRAEKPILPLDNTKPNELELPNLNPENTLFGRWTCPLVKNGYLWLTLHRNHRSAPYDTMFIDTNGNGSLKDETIIKSYFNDESRVRFGPVKIMLTAEKEPIPYHLFFGLSAGDLYELRAYSGGWYEGNILIGPQEMKCRLIDHNVNGAFADISIKPDQSDRIRIGETTHLLRNFIEIDRAMYHPEIAPDGSYIKLTQVPQTMGKVRMPPSTTILTVVAENGQFNLQPENGVLVMPIGNYHIYQWIIEHTDTQGNRWKVKSFWFWLSVEKAAFQVRSAGETSLAIGEPFIAALSVTKQSDKTYSINRTLKGQLGERISLTLNGHRPEPPRVHIKNKDGSYNQTFSLKYG